MSILILCIGNSCRSQMAEAFLKAIDPELEVFSAGTAPAEKVYRFLFPSTNKFKNTENYDINLLKET